MKAREQMVNAQDLSDIFTDITRFAGSKPASGIYFSKGAKMTNMQNKSSRERKLNVLGYPQQTRRTTPKEVLEQWRKIHALRATGKTQAAIAKVMDIAPSSVGKYLKMSEPVLSKDGKRLIPPGAVVHPSGSIVAPRREKERTAFLPKKFEESLEYQIYQQMLPLAVLIARVRREGDHFNYDVFPLNKDRYELAQAAIRMCNHLKPLAVNLLRHAQEDDKRAKIERIKEQK